MASTPRSRRVVVAGDVAMDWNLAQVPADAADGVWNPGGRTVAHLQPGGAALLGELIDAVASRLPRVAGPAEVRRVAPPGAQVRPGDGQFHHSYAVWSPFEYERGSGDKVPRAWRVERFLGVERGPTAGTTDAVGATSGGEADLVVLDDANLGFRETPDLWPRAIRPGAKERPWVLLKMARPVAQGDLWEHLHRHSADRLVVVMTINDLRLTEVQVSRELSWERAAQDLAWELIHNPRVNALSGCAYVVVSFDTAGAFVLSQRRATRGRGDGAECALVFDPAVIEDMWLERHPGGMVGYTSCLAAGVARELLLAPDRPKIRRGVERGLEAMRLLHRDGYGERPAGSGSRVAFPAARVAAGLARVPSTRFAETPVPAPASSKGGGIWTILEDRYPAALGDVARRIALEGAEVALEGVPLGQFGKLLTVDRHEIEGYRSIRTLIREYSRQARPRRPVSIAVFGPPGAGKSFGVVEVAKAVLPDRIKELNFNLSQFNGPAELHDALHQVRDAALGGSLPLVFWDEFDTMLDGEPLGWLRHFLAPMQDGTFQEEQITHPIGPAVFVFAGGTKKRLAEFAAQLEDTGFKNAKGPDFVSRLKGYVDVLGPDPRGGSAATDPYHLVRRAILLRSMLLRDADHLFARKGERKVLRIDPGVLRAFLQTRTYLHGARSLESIVSMSLLSGKGRFERSCLPAEPQLDLHVDARDFLALVQALDLEDAVLERLAEGVHVEYCAEQLGKGLVWNEPDDKYLVRHDRLKPFAASQKRRRRAGAKSNSALVSYERLAEHHKEQSRGLVRDVPGKLALVGCVMRPARGGDEPNSFSDEELEILAEQEHERWMRLKLEQGWCWGEERDATRKLNPALVPWHPLSEDERTRGYGGHARCVGPGELPDDERDKDRALIRAIPTYLDAAGYTIVRTGAEP